MGSSNDMGHEKELGHGRENCRKVREMYRKWKRAIKGKLECEMKFASLRAVESEVNLGSGK